MIPDWSNQQSVVLRFPSDQVCCAHLTAQCRLEQSSYVPHRHRLSSFAFYMSYLLLVAGLGTSTMKEGQEYFNNMERHRIRFNYGGPEDDAALDLVREEKRGRCDIQI